MVILISYKTLSLIEIIMQKRRHGPNHRNNENNNQQHRKSCQDSIFFRANENCVTIRLYVMHRVRCQQIVDLV